MGSSRPRGLSRPTLFIPAADSAFPAVPARSLPPKRTAWPLPSVLRWLPRSGNTHRSAMLGRTNAWGGG